LAASFKRQEAEEVASKGGGGFMFKNFIDGAYRDQDLDDALMWSLPKKLLTEEYRLGGGDRTIAKGYNELWTEFAQKFRDMSKEIAELEIKPSKAEAKKRAGKPQAKVDTKEQKPKAKSKAKAKPKPAEAGTGASTEGGTGGMDVSATTSTAVPKSTSLPAIGKPKATAKAGAGAGGHRGKHEFSDFFFEKPTKPKQTFARHRNRSAPSLACSLGAVVGVKKGFPDERKMAETYPIIARALKHLEVHSDVVARIDRLDVLHAIAQTSTEKYRTTAEGKRAGDLEIVRPPTPPQTKEQILKSLKEARKIPPPPKPL